MFLKQKRKILCRYHSDSTLLTAKACKKDKSIAKKLFKADQTDDKHYAVRENVSNNFQNVFTILQLGVAQN